MSQNDEQPTKLSTLAEPAIRVIQSASSDAAMTRPTDPEATPDEIRASMSSCVVHLCGCN